MGSSRPHICFVAPEAFPLLAEDRGIQFIGGAELQQVIVARALAAKGYPVSMICLDFGQQDLIEIDGIRVLRAYRPDEGVRILRSVWPRFTRMWACLRRANADIYYQRTADRLTGIVACFCQRYGRRSIFAAAGNPDLETRTPRIKYARDRWIYEYGLRHVDRIVVQNDEQARLCRNNFKREAIRVPNCYPEPEGSSKVERNYVLWVSTIRSLKRPQLFLDLAEALPGVQFMMIGGRSNEEQGLFESVRERASGIKNVEFVGFVPYTQIDKYFDAARLFVNTSESEGFPNTFLQAWSRGIPTVSYVDSGARLDGERVGLIVESAHRMVEAVTRMSGSGPEYAVHAVRCRKYFEQNHETHRILEMYEQIFQKLMIVSREREGARGRTGSR